MIEKARFNGEVIFNVAELTDTERCILRQLLEEQLTKIFVRKTLAIAYRGILSKLQDKEG